MTGKLEGFSPEECNSETTFQSVQWSPETRQSLISLWEGFQNVVAFQFCHAFCSLKINFILFYADFFQYDCGGDNAINQNLSPVPGQREKQQLQNAIKDVATVMQLQADKPHRCRSKEKSGNHSPPLGIRLAPQNWHGHILYLHTDASLSAGLQSKG